MGEKKEGVYMVGTKTVPTLRTYAHRVRVQNLPDEQSALQFTRNQLDRLKIGQVGVGFAYTGPPCGTPVAMHAVERPEYSGSAALGMTQRRKAGGPSR